MTGLRTIRKRQQARQHRTAIVWFDYQDPPLIFFIPGKKIKYPTRIRWRQVEPTKSAVSTSRTLYFQDTLWANWPRSDNL